MFWGRISIDEVDRQVALLGLTGRQHRGWPAGLFVSAHEIGRGDKSPTGPHDSGLPYSPLVPVRPVSTAGGLPRARNPPATKIAPSPTTRLNTGASTSVLATPVTRVACRLPSAQRQI